MQLLVSRQLPGGWLNFIFHTRNYLFAPHLCIWLPCLSLRMWPWYLKIPNLPELLIRMSSRHQGFKQVKGLFYLILLTHCLTWNWYFAADDFSSPEYFPGKFWHAAGEPCSTSEKRGDVCLPYRKEMLIKGFKRVEACDLAKSRKWKVIQVPVLKGYLLLSSSLTFALVSNTYNLMWNTLWILLWAAL